MRIPDRRGVFVALVVLLGALVSGCGTTPRSTGTSGPPPLAQTPLGGVELRGVARGPLSGFGPEVDLHAFLRADAALRLELRYRPEDGPPVHEILVWTDEVALLFDRRRGRFTDLGDVPGHVEALGTAFRAEEALWLATTRRPLVPDTDWIRRGDEYRGRLQDHGLRQPVTIPTPWAELVWRQDDAIRTLRTTVEALEGRGATALPRRLRLESEALEGPVVVEWSEVTSFEALGDSILDPLWEPR